MLYVSSSIDDKSQTVPDRMYDLFLEHKSAVIWFCNFLIVVSIILLIKLARRAILKLFKPKTNDDQSKRIKWGLNIIKLFNINLKTLIDLSLQFYALCIYSGKHSYLKSIEIRFSWSPLTPIGIVVFVWMLIYKYIVFYREIREHSKKETIRACILVIYNDWKKLVLCLLFFVEQSWYILILTPILLQSVSLVTFVLCNNIKKRISKIMSIVNECSTIVFWISLISFYNCITLSTKFSKTTGIIMWCYFMIILSIEMIILATQILWELTE